MNTKSPPAGFLDVLLSKADTSGGPDACWPWMKARIPSGYGYTWIPGVRIVTPAHRAVRILIDGRDWDEPSHVLHSCDNPPCVNPAHTRWGTDRENHVDAVVRGRAIYPPNSCRLTPEDVRAIRILRAGGVSRREAAQRFGVSITSISNVTTYRTWRNDSAASANIKPANPRPRVGRHSAGA